MFTVEFKKAQQGCGAFFDFGTFDHFLLMFDVSRGDGCSKEINLCCTEMTFVVYESKPCLMDAFESCSQVGYEMVSIIGCIADVLHIFSATIRLDYFLKLFAHKAGKCRKCPAKALCQTSVGKCESTKVECQHPY